jgi:hypothetical protein
VLSVGYRVNSKRGTQFRIWATGKLREHLLRGYTLNERRLREKGMGEKEALAFESARSAIGSLRQAVAASGSARPVRPGAWRSAGRSPGRFALDSRPGRPLPVRGDVSRAAATVSPLAHSDPG